MEVWRGRSGVGEVWVLMTGARVVVDGVVAAVVVAVVDVAEPDGKCLSTTDSAAAAAAAGVFFVMICWQCFSSRLPPPEIKVPKN
jgi:hypothetical protein